MIHSPSTIAKTLVDHSGPVIYGWEQTQDQTHHRCNNWQSHRHLGLISIPEVYRMWVRSSCRELVILDEWRDMLARDNSKLLDPSAFTSIHRIDMQVIRHRHGRAKTGRAVILCRRLAWFDEAYSIVFLWGKRKSRLFYVFTGFSVEIVPWSSDQ